MKRSINMTIHCSTLCCTKGLERAQMCTLGTSGINCGGYYTALRRNSVIFAMLESFSEYHLKWETKVKNTLHSTCSKCGLQSRSGCIIITRKLVRNEKTFGCSWLSNFTFTFHFHALEKEMATHSSALAWRIPGMAEPGGLPSLGLHKSDTTDMT